MDQYQQYIHKSRYARYLDEEQRREEWGETINRYLAFFVERNQLGASEAEDRKMKSWDVGSAGGASNSDKDAMEVHFLSERALCTLGANNFFLFK